LKKRVNLLPDPGKAIVKKLDKAVADIVCKRDKNICQKCGKYVEGRGCHVSHVIPRSKGNRLRWDIINLKVLCFHCHINWWHKNPVESGEWFKKKFPKRWAYLKKRMNEVKIYKNFDLEELYEDIKKNNKVVI